MDIRFMAGTTPVTLSRHWFTGAMLLQSATEKVWVQHPLHPGTHFSFSLVQSWLRHIAGHEVLVERTRPLLTMSGPSWVSRTPRSARTT